MLVLTALRLSEVHLQGAPSPRSPPPSTPPSTPPSPSPLSAGLVSALSDLRFLVDEAQNHGSDVTVFLAPGAHLKLSSQIKCTSNIKVTVASSGERATLDGQGQTGLFRLEGCSLTLRGLSLVNGKALSLGGGVVSATGGDVEIIDSTVKDCSAGQNGGVISAFRSGTVSLIGSTRGGVVYSQSSDAVALIDTTVTNCSANWDGGVVYSQSSGAVTLTRSTVTGCSAGTRGGVVYAVYSGAVSLTNSTVMDCSAERIGGVVRAVTSESLSVAGVAFINNSAPSGSVLYLDELDRSSISDTSFAGNIAGNGIAIQTGSPIGWDCRLGRWMPRQGALEGDFSAPERRLCPAGYYGAASGLTEPSCSGQCIRGHFCEEGTADPEPCPIGTHMLALGAASNESCIPCAPGQHQPLTGQSDCLTCPAGSFSPDVGLTACDPCPRGGYCAEAGAATRMVWEPCPAGSFNPTTGCKSSAACESCPIGTSSAMRGAESIETCAPCRPGTVAAEERSEICEPCAQGYYQNAVGATECIRCAAGKFCPKGSSLELDAQCDPGTYANLADADGDPECFACPAGLSCAGGGAAPAVCSPGTAAKPARDKCAMCGVGTHQPYAGSASCIPCDPGFFCPEGSSAQLPASCPVGFYNGNASTTLESLDDCVGCALGSFCAGGAAQPTACAPGSIAPSANMSACELCPKGHYAASRTACEECEAGTYAASEGLSLCTPCPHPLSSSSGDVTCSTCKEGFYLLDGANGDPADIFKAPTKHCKPCPPDAICATNTTLETLGIPRNHWRASLLTTEIHECDASDHCSGSEVERSRRRLTATLSTGATADGSGCDTGHTGPLCEWCVSDEQYFDRAERGCADCPPTGRVGLKVVVAALAGAALLSYPALARTECGRYGAVLRLARSESQVGFQPKFKILVSFYQVAATLGPVYGVHLHKDFTRWTNFVDAISFDLLGLAYPNACIGSMRDRILIAALWPIAAIMLGGTALACYALTEWLLSDRTENLRRGLIRNAQSRLLYLAIIVAYLLLPSVSRAIFKAKQCESYDINVFSGERRSYLVADLKVLCSAADVEYRGLDAYFWAFFVLWPVLVPLAFFSLLLWIRPEVVSQRVGDIAGACRFLWRDYEPGFLFWEVVDLLRKLFLASLVLFINIEHGSSKLLRLVVASVVSALFLAALALARPFKQSDDLFLACIANLLLTCCFMLGTVVKLCESAAYEDMCKTLVGFDSARGASAFVIALTAAMLIVSLLVVVLKTVSAVRMPTIRLASSGRPPVLELPPECHFHGLSPAPEPNRKSPPPSPSPPPPIFSPPTQSPPPPSPSPPSSSHPPPPPSPSPPRRGGCRGFCCRYPWFPRC